MEFSLLVMAAEDRRPWFANLAKQIWLEPKITFLNPAEALLNHGDYQMLWLCLDGDLNTGKGFKKQLGVADSAEKAIAFSQEFSTEALHWVLQLKVSGYLLKSQPKSELCMLLADFKERQPLYAPIVWQALLANIQLEPKLFKLTVREKQVLASIGAGLTNSQVARELNLSVNTVASYVKQLYSKLNINSRTEAAVLAAKLEIKTYDV